MSRLLLDTAALFRDLSGLHTFTNRRDLTTTASATFAADRVYRYALCREWDATRPPLVALGLNPSRASEDEDDPTVRKLVGIARRERAGALLLVNAFAYCATDPRHLLLAHDPVGVYADEVIRRAFAFEPAVRLVCTGAPQRRFHDRVRAALRIACAYRPRHLGALTNDGWPRHPLYLRADTPLSGVYVVRGGDG